MTTLLARVFDALESFGSSPCITQATSVDDALSITGFELKEKILGFSKAFTRVGLRGGVLCGLFLDNSIDFLSIFLGIMHAGGVPVIGKREYRSIELEAVFANADPAIVVAEETALDRLRPYLAGRTVVSRTPDGLRVVQRTEATPPGADLSKTVASINYTYRGYGYPLGAIVDERQYLHGANAFQSGLQAQSGGTLLFALPCTHIFTLIGCVFVPLFYGLHAILAMTLHPRRFFAMMRDFAVHHVMAVPEIYGVLTRALQDDQHFPDLVTLGSGGSLLSRDQYLELTERFQTQVLHGYGLTEFTPVTCHDRGSPRPGTIGTVREGIECRIDAPSPGFPGEILLRGPTISSGYYRRPAESRESFAGGWFRTGDAGHFEDDHLIFDHEIKRTCKVNGLLVDLAEVERALCELQAVSAAIAEHSDGRLIARVRTGGIDHRRDLAREIKHALRDRIAAYKIPLAIMSVD